MTGTRPSERLVAVHPGPETVAAGAPVAGRSAEQQGAVSPLPDRGSLASARSAMKALEPIRTALVFTSEGGGRRPRWKLISFLLVAVLPSLLALIYNYGIAADQFVSETRFGIRSMESASVQSSGLLRGLGVADQSGTDSHALIQYIQSREIIDQIQAKIDLRSIFANNNADFLSRFNPKNSIEDLVDYWKKQTDSFYENSTSTVVVRVRAFTREDALTVAKEIHALSEALVNDLSMKARRDSVQFAEQEVLKSESRLLKAQVALRQLRDKEGILDPRKNAETTLGLIAKLRGELTLAQAEMQSQRTFLAAGSPILGVLRTRIASLEAEITKLQGEVTAASGTSGADTLSRVISDYENAEIEKQFSERYYATALELLQKARIEAERQQKYLATFVRPSLAEDALYPKRTRNALTMIAIFFGIWGLGLLLVSSVRDHM